MADCRAWTGEADCMGRRGERVEAHKVDCMGWRVEAMVSASSSKVVMVVEMVEMAGFVGPIPRRAAPTAKTRSDSSSSSSSSSLMPCRIQSNPDSFFLGRGQKSGGFLGS